MTERRPQDQKTAPSTTHTASRVSRKRGKAPLAPASLYAPNPQRKRWMFMYRCKTCGTWNRSLAVTLDEVSGIRRAPCGCTVTVMIARTLT